MLRIDLSCSDSKLLEMFVMNIERSCRETFDRGKVTRLTRETHELLLNEILNRMSSNNGNNK